MREKRFSILGQATKTPNPLLEIEIIRVTLSLRFSAYLKIDDDYKVSLNFLEENNPKDALVNGQIHYLTKECGDEDSKRIVARNFITLFKQHPIGFLGGCFSNEKCTIENVRVECGPRTRQRRESLERRQTSKLYFQVTFTIKVPLLNNSSQDFNKTSVELSETIAADLKETKLDLDIGDVILQADKSVFPVITVAGFACEEGQVERNGRCGEFNFFFLYVAAIIH